jgi:hypothetical protein
MSALRGMMRSHAMAGHSASVDARERANVPACDHSLGFWSDPDVGGRQVVARVKTRRRILVFYYPRRIAPQLSGPMVQLSRICVD